MLEAAEVEEAVAAFEAVVVVAVVAAAAVDYSVLVVAAAGSYCLYVLFSSWTEAASISLSSQDNFCSQVPHWVHHDQTPRSSSRHSACLLQMCWKSRNPQDLNLQRVPQYSLLHHPLCLEIWRMVWRKKI